MHVYALYTTFNTWTSSSLHWSCTNLVNFDVFHSSTRGMCNDDVRTNIWFSSGIWILRNIFKLGQVLESNTEKIVESSIHLYRVGVSVSFPTPTVDFESL